MTRYYADGRPAEFCGRTLRYDAGGRAHMVGRYGEAEVCKAEQRERRLGGDPEAAFRQAMIDAETEPTENLEAAAAIHDRLLQASRDDVARQVGAARAEILTLRLALCQVVNIVKTCKGQVVNIVKTCKGQDYDLAILELVRDTLDRTGRAI